VLLVTCNGDPVSAIAGIYSHSGAPIPRDVVDRLSSGVAVMGPDGDHRWNSPAMAMLCRPLCTEMDSLECRPHVGREGYVLTWDGRLDNRGELTARQFGHDIESIVTSVYRQLDVDGLSLLVGDFALALWDPLRRRLILACDALGRRPLYMLSTGDYVCWASRARALLDAWHKPPQFDDEYVADFLVNTPSVRSPYRSIEQVYGGEAVIVEGARISRKKYWSLQPNATIRYGHDKEYEEQFREIFFEAVRCRIPTNSPVFCELSGGVDSSSIVCSANDICQESSKRRTAVSTISFVFNRSKTADERAYIELVERKVGKRGLHLSEDECPLLETLPYALRPDWPTNTLVFFSRYARTAEEMKRRGARVLLNGIGGDQLFWSEPPEVLCLPDLLVERQIKRFFTTARECARRSGWPYLKVLWRSVAPLLTATRLVTDDERIDLGNWFLPDFMRRPSSTAAAEAVVKC
jgi:asparagine synthase (glutamine-hydrolysing)